MKALTAGFTEIGEAELLKLLGRQLHIETASAAARATYDKLLAALAVRDLSARMKSSKWEANMLKGPQAIAENSKTMREEWEAHLTEKVVDALRRGEWFSRREMVSALKAYSFGRHRGKNGNQIQVGTILRWLTVGQEQHIRLEATNRLNKEPGSLVSMPR